MKRSLRLRFGLVILGALLAAIALISFVLYRQGVALADEMTRLGAEQLALTSEEQQRTRAYQLAETLAPSLIGPVYYADFEGVRQLLETALRQEDVSYALVFDREGRIVHDGSIGIDRYGEPMTDEWAQSALEVHTLTHFPTANGLEVVVPLRIGADRIGGLRLGMSLESSRALAEAQRVALKEASAENLAARTARAMPWVLALIAGAALLSLLVARSLLAPILHLARQARRMADGDYSVRMGIARHDELGELMRSFDAMAEAVGRQHREIAALAFTDTLTGLPNRNRAKALVEAHLAEDEDRRVPFALLLLDLDEFKRVNDSLGHDAGDTLIKELAHRLKRWAEQVAGGDSLARERFAVSRFGGDEFLLLLRDPQPEARAVRLAEVIQNGLSSPFLIDGRQIYVSASVGIALYPEHGQSVELLLKNADIAMYQAKLAGKNGYRLFASAMVEEVSHRLNLETALREAVRNGQLDLYYQPLISLVDQRLIGAEALMRWKRGPYGEVPPSLFIPLAEDTDLIGTLGEWAIREAARQLAQWKPFLPESFYISVNVSPRQLRRQDVSEIVGTALTDHGVAGRHLALEITESSLYDATGSARAMLDRLDQDGVHLWLDDFGTGFSGLSQLRRLPVYGVKVDKSFVAGMEDDPEDLAITQAIIAMAHSMGMRVTAEGIEHEGQARLLRARGCDVGQGFLYSPAVSAQEFGVQLRSTVEVLRLRDEARDERR